MKPTPSIHPTLRLFAAVAVLSLAAISTLSASHLRIYMIGNSLTDDIRYNGFENLVAQGGDSLALGSQRIPGAPIHWHWGNPGGYNHTPFGAYPSAFANYQWDALTLQPTSASYAQELENARYFVQALRGDGTFGPQPSVTPGPGDATGISPDAIVYLYAQNPPNLLAGWNSDYWLNGSPSQFKSRAYYHSFFDDLQALEPQTTVRLIPLGHVFHELHMQTRAGRTPGITHQSDWLIDGSHMNSRGSYVAGLTFYATIYGQDPRGRAPVQPYQVSQELADVIQEAVWAVVSRLPETGRVDGLVVTNPSLPDALENEPYSTQLETIFADGNVTWSLAAGALPAGLSLSPAGVISGTTSDVGFFDIRIRAEDEGGHFDERDFIFFALSSDPPVITSAVLPLARVGTPYHYLLQRSGGVGEAQWSITQGDLPHGLVLSSQGQISGTPISQTGAYSVTLTSTDSLGSQDSIVLNLILAEPETGALIAAPTLNAPSIDGVLNEIMWAELIPIEGSGTPNEPAFSARWDQDALYVAVDVPDSGTRSVNDAVHVFLDGLHRRELALNATDRHIVVHPDGTWEERNSRPSGIEVATSEDATGWSVEVKVPLSNIERASNNQSLSVGFDVAVVQTSGGGALHSLRGTSTSDPIPATMESLVLHVAPITNNLLVDGTFSGTLNKPGYPGEAETSMAGQGWMVNGVPARAFASIDGTQYGFPDYAIVVFGDRACPAYQVIQDNKATKGQGYLRFDVKHASSNIAYRLYGYNGTPEVVDGKLGAMIQEHPVKAGSADAILLSGTLASIPSGSSWQEVALPVDFGEGYDYYLFGFSAAATGIDVDSRIDNVELGPIVPLREHVGGGPAGPRLDTLVKADFSGENLSSHSSWTATQTLHPDVLYSGIKKGPGITAVPGSDGFYYSQNHGATRSTLEYAMTNNQYLEFSISVEDGELDMRGAVLQFHVDRLTNGQAAARFALFSSVDGFAQQNDAIGISHELSQTGGAKPFAFLLPQTEAYQGLPSVTFRLYAFGGQFLGKNISLEGLAIGGLVQQSSTFEAAYEAWSQSISWGGADASMFADASGDGFSNLLAFALAFPDPTQSAPVNMRPSMVFEDAGTPAPQLVYYHRRTTADAGLVFYVETSSNLTNWSLYPGAIQTLVDPDPDGNGSAELWSFSVPAPTTDGLFMRLGIGTED